jgi:hypothetical protein
VDDVADETLTHVKGREWVSGTKVNCGLSFRLNNSKTNRVVLTAVLVEIGTVPKLLSRCQVRFRAKNQLSLGIVEECSICHVIVVVIHRVDSAVGRRKDRINLASHGFGLRQEY